MTGAGGAARRGAGGHASPEASDFLSEGLLEALRVSLAAWPDDAARSDPRKAESYWRYVERKRSAFEGAFALGIRGVPGRGDGPVYVALRFSGGTCAAVELVEEERVDDEVTLGLVCDYADWLEIVGGYDVGKAMTYHRLPLAVGTALDLLRIVYFVYELLGVMAGVPADYPSPVAA